MFTKSCTIILLTIPCAIFAKPDYEKNPFLVGVPKPNEPSLKPKQNINQWNVALVLPPSGQLPQLPPQSSQHPIATSPGFIWLQVPASYLQNKPGGSQKPLEAPQISEPPKGDLLPNNPFISPGIQQPVGPAVHTTQLSPLVGELNRRCIKPTGQFPSAFCNKFINCWNGIATEQACPEGLLFSAKGLYCDYPEKVDCSQRPVAATPPQAIIPQEPFVTIGPAVITTQIPISVAPTQGAIPQGPGDIDHAVQTTYVPPTGGELNKNCLKPRGQFPSNACNTFLNCWNGIATEQACPEGLLFNAAGYCDFPEHVNCAGKPIEGSTPAATIPDDAKSPTASPVPGQSSSAPTTPWTNPTTLSPPTTATLPTVLVDPILKKKCLTPRGQFPSTSCNKFVNCWDDVILEQECPAGFLFSTKGYCDFPHNVKCGDREISFARTDTKSECPTENGMFRDKIKCNSYYTCISNKIAAKYECPEGFNFNDNIGVCDYAYRVDCSKDPLVFPGRRNFGLQTNDAMSTENFFTVVNKETSATSECPVEFGTFRDSKNCSTYFTCAYKKIVAKYDCPTGFNFNDNIGVCDYSERVDCTLPPKIFQVKQNILPHISADFKDKIDKCTPGTMFRLNPQCTSACLCRNGMAEIIQCPAGLAYDSVLDKCILPHLAKC